MVVRYNPKYDIPRVVAKHSYKRRSKKKNLVSNTKNVSIVTPENKIFLKSLGLEVLI